MPLAVYQLHTRLVVASGVALAAVPGLALYCLMMTIDLNEE